MGSHQGREFMHVACSMSRAGLGRHKGKVQPLLLAYLLSLRRRWFCNIKVKEGTVKKLLTEITMGSYKAFLRSDRFQEEAKV